MKIAYFLTPKSQVAWVKSSATVRQALERMDHHGYAAVPLLSADGGYVGVLTEGDLLRFIKQNPHLRFSDTEELRLSDVPRRQVVRPVDIDAEIEELLALALDQNFVPVVDGRQAFIGIVRRRSILAYFQERMRATLQVDAGPPEGVL